MIIETIVLFTAATLFTIGVLLVAVQAAHAWKQWRR